MTICGNTIFNDLGQTDDINLDASGAGQDVANKTVVNNLLAGGGYSVYGGRSRNRPTSNIVIEDNEFGRLFYPQGRPYRPAPYVHPPPARHRPSANPWPRTTPPRHRPH